MKSTRQWLEYFRNNQEESAEIVWERASLPSAPLRDFLIPSLQQFQLGENAAGRHFLELAREHGRATGDFDFPEAIALFIGEEQRHSMMLAHYLHRVGAPLLTAHWTHAWFRRFRHWAGLESKVTVLVMAEIMAVPYYRAVMVAAHCPVLTAICRRILREEAQHLRFQGNTLRRLGAHRPAWQVAVNEELQRTLMTATCLLTWFEHRHVFAAAGHTFKDVWRAASAALTVVQRSANPKEKIMMQETCPADQIV